MAFEDALTGLTTGLASGALAGTQLGLQQESLDIRRSRSEALTGQLPTPEDIETNRQLRLEGLDKIQRENETAEQEQALLNDFKTPSDHFVQQLGEVATPKMLQLFEERFRLTHGDAINQAGMINKKQFQDFFEDFKDAPDFAQTSGTIFTEGIKESETRKEALVNDLANLSEKPQTSKTLEESQRLQAEIAEHDEAKNILNRMIGRVKAIGEQPAQAGFPPEIQSQLELIAQDIRTVRESGLENDEEFRLITKLIQEGMSAVPLDQQGKAENFLRPFAERTSIFD